MTGGYLEQQVNGRLIQPILAFRLYVFQDVLPAFGNLSDRANQMAREYFDRIGAQPAGEDCDGDMASVAEEAEDLALSWYQMMVSLRQSMLNLLAAGLFHLTEQQLAALTHDASFKSRPTDTKLDVVAPWYKCHLRLDLKSLPSWRSIDELRLVANAVKHAEGSSADNLRALRPELFRNPDFEYIDKTLQAHGVQCHVELPPIQAPLAGEGLFITESLLREYAEVAESFFSEIAGHFHDHEDDFY